MVMNSAMFYLLQETCTSRLIQVFCTIFCVCVTAITYLDGRHLLGA